MELASETVREVRPSAWCSAVLYVAGQEFEFSKDGKNFVYTKSHPRIEIPIGSLPVLYALAKSGTRGMIVKLPCAKDFWAVKIRYGILIGDVPTASDYSWSFNSEDIRTFFGYVRTYRPNMLEGLKYAANRGGERGAG